jgi:hypothetical protein
MPVLAILMTLNVLPALMLHALLLTNGAVLLQLMVVILILQQIPAIPVLGI